MADWDPKDKIVIGKETNETHLFDDLPPSEQLCSSNGNVEKFSSTLWPQKCGGKAPLEKVHCAVVVVKLMEMSGENNGGGQKWYPSDSKDFILFSLFFATFERGDFFLGVLQL